MERFAANAERSSELIDSPKSSMRQLAGPRSTMGFRAFVCDAPPGYVCDDPNTTADESTQPQPCEDVVGAGVVHPRGIGSSNADCGFTSGQRYIDATQPDIAQAFSCAAQVGTLTKDVNDPELPMQAMVDALSSGSAAAGCNGGFLRDDAILVITFITDEDDDVANGSPGTPEAWYDAVVAAKHGDPSAVVVLGIYGLSGSACAESSSRLDAFVDLWGAQGFRGEICGGNYNQVFEDAVGTIDTTCEDFVPPAG